jgi:hypothetical protein
MSIHKVTNTFVGNGSALEADVNTLTPGKLGLFTMGNTALAAAYSAGSATQKIQVSETFADGSFKKSMWIDGSSVISARAEGYAPATREVWTIGYQRGYRNADGTTYTAAGGSIEVNNASDYTASIRFKNDKSLYSERPEMLRINFTSSATATQLSIATQIAAVINNGGFKTVVSAVVVGNGTGVYGLTSATAWGVEISALDINQFRSSTYKENRVYFSVQVDDSTGFGSSTTCTQISANSYGEGTYNYIYNKENFDYQYEGLSNRRLWPAQSVSFNVNSTPVLSLAITPTATTVLGSDVVTFSATVATILRPGELITLAGINYEIKYFINTTTAVLTVPYLVTGASGVAVKVRCFYSIIVLEFNDNSFTSGADLISVARKSVYIATPAIDAGATWTTFAGAITAGSTEGNATSGLLKKLNDWLATTPAAPATLAF